MLTRLIEKTERENARFTVRFNTEDTKDKWGIKYWPEPNNDGHFWAYGSSLDEVIHKIISEMEGF